MQSRVHQIVEFCRQIGSDPYACSWDTDTWRQYNGKWQRVLREDTTGLYVQEIRSRHTFLVLRVTVGNKKFWPSLRHVRLSPFILLTTSKMPGLTRDPTEDIDYSDIEAK